MKPLLLTILFLPILAIADAKYEFSCAPIEGETSFRLKGYFYEDRQGEDIGFAHSYAIFGEYESLPECRVPWYEKFPINGGSSKKMLLHWREYMPSCNQNFQIPTVTANGYMWVSKAGDMYTKSKAINAYCTVNKVN